MSIFLFLKQKIDFYKIKSTHEAYNLALALTLVTTCGYASEVRNSGLQLKRNKKTQKAHQRKTNQAPRCNISFSINSAARAFERLASSPAPTMALKAAFNCCTTFLKKLPNTNLFGPLQSPAHATQHDHQRA